MGEGSVVLQQYYEVQIIRIFALIHNFVTYISPSTTTSEF